MFVDKTCTLLPLGLSTKMKPLASKIIETATKITVWFEKNWKNCLKGEEKKKVNLTLYMKKNDYYFLRIAVPGIHRQNSNPTPKSHGTNVNMQ